MPRVRVRYFIDILWLWHHTIKYYIQKLNYIFNCSMVFCDSYFCNISKSPICHGVFSRLRQQKFWMSQYGYNRKNPWYQHRQFSTTEPIFTKILHNIAALVALLNHAYTRRYPIPFLNAGATKVWSLPFFYKIGCHATSLEISEKEVQIVHLHPKCFHLVKRLSKSVQCILHLEEIIKKDKARNAWQSLVNSPLGAAVSPPSK